LGAIVYNQVGVVYDEQNSNWEGCDNCRDNHWFSKRASIPINASVSPGFRSRPWRGVVVPSNWLAQYGPPALDVSFRSKSPTLT
jgi:hypothetical protein